MSDQLALLQAVALLKSGAPANRIRAELVSKLSTQQRHQLEFIWSVSRHSGGMLVLSLQRLAEVVKKQQESLAQLKLAFSAPRASANLILLLPLLVVLLGELFGLAILATALASSIGLASLSLGLLMLIAARLISLRMLAKATPREHDPGAFLDAVAIGLSAGLATQSAIALAEREYEKSFSSEQLASKNLEELVASAKQSGMPLAALMRARADQLRAEVWQRAGEQIAKLSISLVLPLGLVALPAFLLVAVVPIGLGLFRVG